MPIKRRRWTSTDDRLLRRWIRQAVKHAEIGRRLGGRSRQAVKIRAHRLRRGRR